MQQEGEEKTTNELMKTIEEQALHEKAEAEKNCKCAACGQVPDQQEHSSIRNHPKEAEMR